MLIRGAGLLVSVPAKELDAVCPPGSIFKDTVLRNTPLSVELRLALDVARHACAKKRVPLLIVARPEIFTHGLALQWLRDQLGGIEDHLCISDGTAVRPIPLLRNHLFLYRLGIYENAAAFHRLSHCAPELLASMHSQVNTCMTFGPVHSPVCPPPILLQVTEPRRKPKSPTLYRYVHGQSLQTCVTKTLQLELPAREALSNFKRLTYIPLTETACKDSAFCRAVMQAICESGPNPDVGVILRIPYIGLQTATIEDRIRTVIEFIRSAGSIPSRLAPHSVVFASTNLFSSDISRLARPIDFLMHSSFEFWSCSTEFYEQFRKLDVFFPRVSAGDQTELHRLLVPAFKRRPELRQLKHLRTTQSKPIRSRGLGLPA